MCSVYSNEIWLQFLRNYKSHRCLWDTNFADYSNRMLRNQAYEEMASDLRKVIPEANVDFVRKRISNCLASYKREAKKVVAARENNLKYEPMLFYYDLVNSFLRLDGEESKADSQSDSEDEDPFASLHSMKEEHHIDMDDQVEHSSDISSSRNNFNNKRKSTSALKTSPKFQNDNDVDLHESPVAIKQKRNNSSYKQKRRKKRQLTKRHSIARDTESSDEEIEEEFKEKIQKKHEDECDILGRRFASHFRHMETTQRFFAEQIMLKICIYGRLNQLSMHSDFSLETPMSES